MKNLERFFSSLLDSLSNSLANRKGLLPLIGIRITSYNVCYTKLLRDEGSAKCHIESSSQSLVCDIRND